MPSWASLLAPRNATTSLLSGAAVLTIASQALPWVTLTMTTDFTYNVYAWVLEVPLAFASGDLSFANHPWWHDSFDDAPRIWALRLAGPALALATLAAAAGALSAWKARRGAAVTMADATCALALAGVVLAASGAAAFNGQLPAGRYATTLGPGGFLAAAALPLATFGAVLARRLPRPQAPPERTVSTPGSGWTPPPGFDAETGLYVGDRK